MSPNGMSPMRNTVYNRPGESHSFSRRNDGDLYTYRHQSHISQPMDSLDFEPADAVSSDAHYLKATVRSGFDTVSLHSAGRDDHNAFSYDSMSLCSLDNHLQNWSPLSEEVRPKLAAKRSPVSKRPCTPEHDNKVSSSQWPCDWGIYCQDVQTGCDIVFGLRVFDPVLGVFRELQELIVQRPPVQLH